MLSSHRSSDTRFYLFAWLFVVTAAVWCLVQPGFFVCPSKLLFHFPCPGCGLTHALNDLLNGQPLDALHHNPLIFILLPLAIVTLAILIFDALTRRHLALALWDKCNQLLHKPLPLTVVILVIAAAWIFKSLV